MSAALPASVVLFDLDGTLTDSAPGIHAGFRHALASVGAPEPTEQQLSLVVGPPLIDTLRSMGLDEEAAQRALAAYFDRYDERGWAENTAFDGIETVLTRLQDRGVRRFDRSHGDFAIALRSVRVAGEKQTARVKDR